MRLLKIVDRIMEFISVCFYPFIAFEMLAGISTLIKGGNTLIGAFLVLQSIGILYQQELGRKFLTRKGQSDEWIKKQIIRSKCNLCGVHLFPKELRNFYE